MPPAELAAHLGSCADCQAYSRRLRDLERAVGELPVPAGSARAREAFLERVLSPSRVVTPRYRTLRPALAIAAVFVIAVTLGVWIYSGGEDDDPAAFETSAAVLDGTIDLNLQLASTDSLEERERVYVERRPKLANRLRTARLNAEDRRLAEQLLDKATYLSKTTDPMDEAEHLTDAEDLLVRRVSDAAAKKDARRMAKLSNLYEKLVEGGVNAKLERASERSAKPDDDADRRMKRLERRNVESRQRFLSAAEGSSVATGEEVRRAVEVSKKPWKKRPASRPSKSDAQP